MTESNKAEEPMTAEMLRKEYDEYYAALPDEDLVEPFDTWLIRRLIAFSEEREKELGEAVGFALRWITRDGAEPTENVMAEHIAQDLTGQCFAAFLESKKEKT
jgi:hypothetical protein